MSSHAAIPALPVLVPAGAVVAGLLLRRLRRRGGLTRARAAVVIAACGYAAALIGETFFPIPLAPPESDLPWWIWINPVPIITADPAGIVLNLALFVPLGVLLPLATRATSLHRVVLLAATISCGIELTQFLLDLAVELGRVADVDDVLANTAGAVVGLAVFRGACRIPAVAAAAATVPPHGTARRRSAVAAAAR